MILDRCSAYWNFHNPNFYVDKLQTEPQSSFEVKMIYLAAKI